MRLNLVVLGFKLAALAALAAATPSPAAAQTGLLREGRCRLVSGALPAAYARCGTLAVPLDPSNPAGPAVDVFVARVAALSSEPRPDPLLLIAGGPGQSTVDMYLQLRSAFEPARRDRDLILVDQRGTGRSAEGFACAAPDDLSLDTAGPAELERIVDGCLAQLEHDARFYTTSVAVQDLERVRAALGVERWNVYGVSYGTRVAQHYLRRFPQHSRAVVLDGVVPAPLALGPDVAREAQRALEQIFARCAADARCSAKFTDLPGAFAELLARLDAVAAGGAADRPPLTALELRALVRFMSYNVATVALLPVLITEAHAGNYAPLAAQARTLLRDLPESLSFPMSSSVNCTEDLPYANDAGDGLGATYLGTAVVEGLRLICGRWPIGTIDADFKEPVVSEKPLLLLSGEFDPITPPAYAQRVIDGGLRNARHLVGRGQGHGLIGVGCVPRIVRAFLETPLPGELDASCLEAEPPTPFFLSLLGPAP